ncbi:hypothetical protein QC820_16495 [Halomonas mongoliensis]|uniref:Uncharacterized protein n=1 Tax=Halomonas mongoliensis TaxID=321265 RepID=A0ABU1GQV7_9GAMM|nr:hypothetical protein [Halomonas mongoliensis]MDR5894390.1 hypothetical protein [Halomonas mongoliensis]
MIIKYVKGFLIIYAILASVVQMVFGFALMSGRATSDSEAMAQFALSTAIPALVLVAVITLWERRRNRS